MLARNHCWCLFCCFFLTSGNHPGSDRCHHGQSHMLHMSCSHLQKDPEEWLRCSGELPPCPLILFSEHFEPFTCFVLLCCSSCCVLASASSSSAPLPPSQFRPVPPAPASKFILPQQLTGTGSRYQNSLNRTVKIMTSSNGWQTLTQLMDWKWKWFFNEPWKHLPQQARAGAVLQRVQLDNTIACNYFM